jgi:hypothetical protein
MEYKCIWIIRDQAEWVGWTWTWLGNRAGFWLHLFRLCQLRTVRCIAWTLVKSQIYCPEDILAYGGGKTCFSLVMGSGSFRTGFLGWSYILGWGGLSTMLKAGLQCWGLRVWAWTGTWTLDRSGTGWSCLCPGYEQDVCFWGTQLDILIRESPFLCDGMAWLRSDIIVITNSWKMKKLFLLLNPAWL